MFQEFLCKLYGSFQSTCVFFSSFSTLLIAIDRYRFIMRPTQKQISIQMVGTQKILLTFNMCVQAILLSIFSIVISIIMSSPLFIFSELEVYENLFTDGFTSFCTEVHSKDKRCNILKGDLLRIGIQIVVIMSSTSSSAFLSSMSLQASPWFSFTTKFAIISPAFLSTTCRVKE